MERDEKKKGETIDRGKEKKVERISNYCQPLRKKFGLASVCRHVGRVSSISFCKYADRFRREWDVSAVSEGETESTSS